MNANPNWVRMAAQDEGEWKVLEREELEALRERGVRIPDLKEVRRNERYDG